MWRRTASIFSFPSSSSSSFFSSQASSSLSVPSLSSFKTTTSPSLLLSSSLPLSIPSTPQTTTAKRFLNLPQNFVPYPSSSRPPVFKKLDVSQINEQKERQQQVKDELKNHVPLSSLFPGAPNPKDSKTFEVPPPQFSTLENGVTVATQEIYGGTFNVEVMFKVGVLNETKKGMVAVLQHLAFQSCAEDPNCVKFLTEAGANIFANGLPEVFSFSGEGLRHHLPQITTNTTSQT